MLPVVCLKYECGVDGVRQDGKHTQEVYDTHRHSDLSIDTVVCGHYAGADPSLLVVLSDKKPQNKSRPGSVSGCRWVARSRIRPWAVWCPGDRPSMRSVYVINTISRAGEGWDCSQTGELMGGETRKY